MKHQIATYTNDTELFERIKERAESLDRSVSKYVLRLIKKDLEKINK